jgi:hypothetical protein
MQKTSDEIDVLQAVPEYRVVDRDEHTANIVAICCLRETVAHLNQQKEVDRGSNRAYWG